MWSFDTGAFLVGRQIGRHKFLTHISPAKSIEGVIGGLVATTLVTALMLAGLGQQPARRPHPRAAARAHGAGGRPRRVDAQARRRAKDSGTLIPGHGGMLDRIDSFLFAAPVVALYVLALAG